MAFKEPKSEKHYYSIGEVAAKFGLAPSTLRFWEKEFDTRAPKGKGAQVAIEVFAKRGLHTLDKNRRFIFLKKKCQ